jgi:hypothetical protein
MTSVYDLCDAPVEGRDGICAVRLLLSILTRLAHESMIVFLVIIENVVP